MALVRIDTPLFKIHPAKVVHKQSVSLRPIEHHYENEGEEPYIKYSCQLCEGLAKAVKGFSFYEEGGRFINFSFPKGTPNCPCCGVNIDWGYKENLLGMAEPIDEEAGTQPDTQAETQPHPQPEVPTSVCKKDEVEKKNYIIEQLKTEMVETQLLLVEERIPKGNCPFAYYSPRKGAEEIDCETTDCSVCRENFLEIMEEEITDKLEEMIKDWEAEFDKKTV